MARITIVATPTEIAELQQAVKDNCTCNVDCRCSACHMLANDQRAINGLVFVRRTLVARMLEAEFNLSFAFADDYRNLEDCQ